MERGAWSVESSVLSVGKNRDGKWRSACGERSVRCGLVAEREVRSVEYG